jgi:hypothetical protein
MIKEGLNDFVSALEVLLCCRVNAVKFWSIHAMDILCAAPNLPKPAGNHHQWLVYEVSNNLSFSTSNH